MKIPLSWLQEYITLTLPPADVANRLTMAGIEVKGRQVIGDWENIVVGQIIAVKLHPNAERLSLVTVDLGTEQQTVVTGAPNLRLGDKVAFAYVGAQLIDGHSGQPFRLKSAKIRGVLSNGMVCSEKELGISDNHEEIMVLPAEAPVGTPLADIALSKSLRNKLKETLGPEGYVSALADMGEVDDRSIKELLKSTAESGEALTAAAEEDMPGKVRDEPVKKF